MQRAHKRLRGCHHTYPEYPRAWYHARGRSRRERNDATHDTDAVAAALAIALPVHLLEQCHAELQLCTRPTEHRPTKVRPASSHGP